MKILFVNHTFPPESYAGSEIFVFNLATEFQQRGHRVAVFYRYANSQDEEYRLIHDYFQTIPTVKINHTYRYCRSFQDIYVNPAINAKFGYFLREFQPDVVHFNHVTNLSMSLVKEAKAFGAVVIYTIHDYWLLCQRGQLLKQDLSLCQGPSLDACRSCLAPQLLKGSVSRLVSKLFRRSNLPVSQSHIAYDLMNLKKARIKTENSQFVKLSSFDGNHYNVEVLQSHPPAEISYKIHVEHPVVFLAEIGMHPSTYSKPGQGVGFEVFVDDRCLFNQKLNPKENPEDHGWHPVRLELPVTDKTHHLVLKTSALGEDNQFCTAGWRLPRLEYRDTNIHSSISYSDFERRLHLKQLGQQAATILAETAAAFSPSAYEGIEHRSNWIKRLWCDVDRFVAPSRFLQQFYIRHGLPAEKIIYSDYGFVFPEKQMQKSLHTPLRFGYLGTWIPSKGLDVALKAFRHVSPQNARIFVHGYFPGYDGFEDYEDYLRSLDSPAVLWKGKYHPSSVFDLLTELDCLVMPSIWWENSPLTIHEAFLAYVPVITADVGGMAELVREGGGMTFKHREPSSLEKVVHQIIEQPELLEIMKATIPAVKPIEQNADEMMAIYLDGMNKNHGEKVSQ